MLVKALDDADPLFCGNPHSIYISILTTAGWRNLGYGGHETKVSMPGAVQEKGGRRAWSQVRS
jgi:hypothetical protein